MPSCQGFLKIEANNCSRKFRPLNCHIHMCGDVEYDYIFHTLKIWGTLIL